MITPEQIAEWREAAERLLNRPTVDLTDKALFREVGNNFLRLLDEVVRVNNELRIAYDCMNDDKECYAENKKLLVENERYREALQWYADKNRYLHPDEYKDRPILEDWGARARKVLGEE